MYSYSSIQGWIKSEKEQVDDFCVFLKEIRILRSLQYGFYWFRLKEWKALSSYHSREIDLMNPYRSSTKPAPRKEKLKALLLMSSVEMVVTACLFFATVDASWISYIRCKGIAVIFMDWTARLLFFIFVSSWLLGCCIWPSLSFCSISYDDITIALFSFMNKLFSSEKWVVKTDPFSFPFLSLFSHSHSKSKIKANTTPNALF